MKPIIAHQMMPTCFAGSCFRGNCSRDSNCTVHESPARRSVLHPQCASQVVVGLGVIRFQAEGFLELTDRLVYLAVLAQGGAEVVVGLGVIRFQAEGFLVLPDRLVDLALPGEGDAEVVVGVGVIRFQADGFLVLADRLVSLAFLGEGGAAGCSGPRRNPVSGGWLPGIGGSPRRIWPFSARAKPRL